MQYTLAEAHLTPDQRSRKVASILARGVLRLRPAPSESSESRDALKRTQKGLDVSVKSRPHG